jgi:hypothetical protein
VAQEALDGVRGARRREVMALRHVAVEPAQDLVLVMALDAFRDDLEI